MARWTTIVGVLFFVAVGTIQAAELELVDGRTLLCQGLSFGEDGALVILADKPATVIPWSQISPDSLSAEHREIQHNYILSHLQNARDNAERDPTRASGLILSLRPFMESVDDQVRESYQWIEAQSLVASEGTVAAVETPDPFEPKDEEEESSTGKAIELLNDTKDKVLHLPRWQQLTGIAVLLGILIGIVILRRRNS